MTAGRDTSSSLQTDTRILCNPLLTEEGIIPYPKPLHKKSGPLLGGPEGGDICNWAQASTVWLHGQFIKYMFHITVEPSGT